jgi:hypothetical protein
VEIVMMTSRPARVPPRGRWVRLIGGIVMALTILAPGHLQAHAQGEDYVVFRFQERTIEGHFEIATLDLKEKLGLAIAAGTDNGVSAVTASAATVEAYIDSHFSVGPEDGQPYALEFVRYDTVSLPQGLFAQYHFRVDTGGPLPDRLAIRHGMFYEDDRLHRGLVLVEYNAKTDTTYPGEFTAMVFHPGNAEQTLDLTAIPSLMAPRDMIGQGVWHIWIGIDHILFLLALMLPTVLVRQREDWQPVETFSRAFLNLLKIVTVFTVAHSITLVLAALDVIALPSRLVESIIALSIILVALNNIFGRIREGSLLIILALGLFHGLGFASVMGNLPFRMVDLLRIVIGFNIGVELGQVAIVAVLFPFLYLMRRSSLYQPLVLRGASVVLVLISGWWFVQRSLGLE